MSQITPRRTSSLLLAGLLAVGGAASAEAATSAQKVVIKGAGFGHGVGMSQYGAYGFAKNGTGWREILAHYYTGTELQPLAAKREITVLLMGGRPSVQLTGAAKVGGEELDPDARYVVRKSGTGVVIREAGGDEVLRTSGPVRATGPGGAPIKLLGTAGNGVRDGRYRGAIELRQSFGGVTAINALSADDYVRGVVSGESPASWPIDALRAQAVAARTYALTSDAGTATDGFTQYPDQRSQVYRGIAAEYPSTDRAVADTAGIVVTYEGKPVTTFFFSTSGGRTENIENSFIGASPKPWLKSVDDPYDKLAPRHRWQLTYSRKQLQQKLSGFVRGTFKRVKVVKRGVSPRIVDALVVGSKGSTAITGPQLRARLGLYDTWASFTTIGSKTTTTKPKPKPKPAGTPPVDGDSTSGGAGSSPTAGAARARVHRISGTIVPGRTGAWVRVQRRQDGRWTTVADTKLGKGGRYAATLPGRGTYRVAYGRMAGPAVVAR